jgi:hypothetical protein
MKNETFDVENFFAARAGFGYFQISHIVFTTTSPFSNSKLQLTLRKDENN